MSSPRYEDVIALIRLLLQGASAVNDVIQGRVQGPNLIDSDAQSVELPVVVVDPFSGVGQYQPAGPHALTVYVYAYHEGSLGSALSLYDDVFDALQAKRLFDPDGKIPIAGTSRETSRPITGFNDKIKAHFARGVWAVTVM